MKMILERSEKTGRWIQSRRTSGLCFTISPKALEATLRAGFRTGTCTFKLSDDETIDRFMFDNRGLTVFLKP
jgi:hypothetical protein